MNIRRPILLQLKKVHDLLLLDGPRPPPKTVTSACLRGRPGPSSAERRRRRMRLDFRRHRHTESARLRALVVSRLALLLGPRLLPPARRNRHTF